MIFPMDKQSAHLRDLAVRYRRLATEMSDPATVGALKAKAREFEEEAEQIEVHTRRSRLH
ncbi:MAG: hypothetical protein ABW003_20880 [Microvirga sp.]